MVDTGSVDFVPFILGIGATLFVLLVIFVLFRR